jgi:sugar transferase (PEP-CTERM/EpsH1 system associated)
MALHAGRVRVVHLVLSLGVGGLEKVVMDLARFMARDRFECRVLCLREKGAQAIRLEAAGIPVESLNCPELPKVRTLLRLIQRLRELQPQVLHTHNPGPHLFGALAAPAVWIRVLVHTKHGRNQPRRPLAVMVNRLAALLSNCIVAVSEGTELVARRVERIPERKLHVIHNGIDPSGFPSRVQRSATPGCRAIHVARLQRIKDQPTLLHAARLVVDAEPGFRLDIVGDGPDRADLTALVEKLGLGGHVRFLGQRDDVANLLAGADLFVLSSVSEGVPMTLLEAMAAGLPAVVTDVGGNREIVVPRETGFVVPPQSPTALADAIVKIMRDPAMAQRMGEASRRRVEADFDVRQVVARYQALYCKLLGRSL